MASLGAGLQLTTNAPFDNNTPVLAYDASGGRRLIASRSGRSGSSGTDLEYRLGDLPLEKIEDY